MKHGFEKRWGLCVLVIFVGLSICSLPRRSEAADDVLRRKLGTRTTLYWECVPLRPGLERLSQAQGITIFLDRRVDPSELTDISMESASLGLVLDRIADQHDCAVAYIGPVVYLGPIRITRSLQALADQKREEVSRKSLRLRRTLHVKRKIKWPVLTAPRALVARIADERGIRVNGLDRIPHDLWPASELPAAPLADQLTILLAGFDLAWQPTSNRCGLEIVPISAEELAGLKTVGGDQRPGINSNVPRQHQPTRGGKTLYTLRVTEQPVGPVLRQLASKLDFKIEFDTKAIEVAGVLLSQRISFEVKNASLEKLLNAAVTSAGLTYELDGKKLRIFPVNQ